MLKDIVRKNRSYRRFYQEERLSPETLRDLIALARVTPSTGNTQSLRFRPVCAPEDCAGVFSTLGWAGLLPDWPGPGEGERPAAYILILTDKALDSKRGTDVGIAAQTILLGATELGYGGCMLGNVKRNELLALQGLDPEKYALPLVIALGRPKEDVRLVDAVDGGTRYYRDAAGVHYVPKLPLEDLII